MNWSCSHVTWHTRTRHFKLEIVFNAWPNFERNNKSNVIIYFDTWWIVYIFIQLKPLSPNYDTFTRRKILCNLIMSEINQRTKNNNNWRKKLIIDQVVVVRLHSVAFLIKRAYHWLSISYLSRIIIIDLLFHSYDKICVRFTNKHTRTHTRHVFLLYFSLLLLECVSSTVHTYTSHFDLWAFGVIMLLPVSVY